MINDGQLTCSGLFCIDGTKFPFSFNADRGFNTKVHGSAESVRLARTCEISRYCQWGIMALSSIYRVGCTATHGH